MRIRVAWPRGQVVVRLADTPTARRLYKSLPHRTTAQTWGEEVYFEVPMRAEPEPGAREVVEPGTVCYWPEGRALAIPYGPTPIAEHGECRLASACTVLGRVEGHLERLRTIRDGDPIRISLVGEA
ncbi:cyclophilin-like fold protein [Inmirania thermothiophila]|uniref:Cyclophilin TM1367-like domain-containing protein n=1 Tax=Inmirania thermothiophila TaxID=1750597 RepID=A0A3N1XU65_9GAMM|nr:cyclophilin-like fold protein [Inmirania thermothiophila]ROR29721.1 hypothetical protein EDC57_2398 [Inmirania thermothiophila]